MRGQCKVRAEVDLLTGLEVLDIADGRLRYSDIPDEADAER